MPVLLSLGTAWKEPFLEDRADMPALRAMDRNLLPRWVVRIVGVHHFGVINLVLRVPSVALTGPDTRIVCVLVNNLAPFLFDIRMFLNRSHDVLFLSSEDLHAPER